MNIVINTLKRYLLFNIQLIIKTNTEHFPVEAIRVISHSTSQFFQLDKKQSPVLELQTECK